MMQRPIAAAALLFAVSAGAAQARITFDLDYSLDANGFFNTSTTNGAAARAALTRAADTYSDRLLDSLSPITTSGSNTWTPVIRNPATAVTNYAVTGLPNVPANTLKVFAGGRDEPGTTLGVGGPGGYSASGTSSFLDTLKGRGQSGATLAAPTDFGPWGGSIGFDSGTTWNYSVSSLPVSSQNDFYSVSLHELGHLLGFGTSTSFTSTLTTGLQFTGAKSKALNGGANVPLENAGHLGSGLLSTVTGTGTQQPAMTPSIVTGTRKLLTLLDWAGLDDLGWDLAKPGDANADGSVNFDDLLTLAQNYGTASSAITWSEGDFNYTGSVNFDDLLALAQSYGTSGPLSAGDVIGGTAISESFAADWALAQSLVPEPGTLALVAPAIAVLRRRRRVA